jgi:transcription elongation factor GreA
MPEEHKATIGETATQFLASLPPEDREGSQQEVYRFARWCGWDNPMAELRASAVASYAEQAASSGAADAVKSLEPVRAFLSYAKAKKLLKTGLVAHLKVKKVTAPVSAGKAQPTHSLSPEGYAQIKAELEALKRQRPAMAEELRLARADKDFAENAPLDATRERQGQLEARIRELESILKTAVVAGGEAQVGQRVAPGKRVTLTDLDSGEQVQYTLVYPKEASPLHSKISIASPLGQTLLGKGQGEEVEVSAPGGKIGYRIEAIED